MEALNDLLQLPFVEDCACCGFYLFLALTSPLWLLCLSLCALGEFPFFQILRSHENIKPGPGRGGILITGASRGYHLELVQQLVEEGWVVYGGTMTQAGMETLKQLAAALEKKQDQGGAKGAASHPSRASKGKKGKDSPTGGEHGCGDASGTGRLVPLWVDVTDASSIREAVARISTDCPTAGLHALVTAEATGQSGPCEWLTPQHFHDNIQVNYCGTVSVTLAMLPLLKLSSPHSRVVHVTPSAGLYPLLAPLSAATQATHAFTHALRVEMAPQKLHVCAVSTGLGYSRRDSLGREVETSLLQRWAHLDEGTRTLYGPTYVHEALDALRLLAKENGLRSRHVLKTLHHAIVSPNPRRQYTVGLDTKFFKPLLRLLPVSLRDTLLQWWTGEALTPQTLRRPQSDCPAASASGAPWDQNSSDSSSSSSSEGSGEEEEEGEEREEWGVEQGHRGAGSAMCRCRLEYEVQGVLGEGAYAVVRLATHRHTGTQVALKMLRRKALSTPRALQAINREIQFLERLSSLRDRHLLHYYGKLSDDDNPPGALILVLEYCPGGDLFDHVASSGQYSMRDAATTTRHLLLGLQAMHSHGVIHRDVKPENCMYGLDKATGRPLLKLGDFGLAMFYDRQAKHPPSSPRDNPTDSLAGTPGYMSPEVIRHRLYTDKCDVWGAGVVLWILLCGCPPFSGKTHHQVFSSILHHTPSPNPTAWRDVSDAAKQCVLALLNPDPKKRPTVEEALNLPFLRSPSHVSDQPLTHAFSSIQQLKLRARFRALAKVCIALQHARHHPSSPHPQPQTQEGQEIHATTHLDSKKPSPSPSPSPTPSPIPSPLPSPRSSSLPSLPQQLTHWLLGSPSPLLTPTELTRLRREWACAMPRGGGGLDLQGFKGVMGRLGKNRLPLERLFHLFDRDHNGSLDFDELQQGLARFRTRGQDALTFLFEVLDEDGSGSISRNELASLLLYHRQHALRLQDGSESCIEVDPEGYELTEAIADFFEAFDADGDGEVTLSEFLSGAEKRPDLVALLLGERATGERKEAGGKAGGGAHRKGNVSQSHQ